MQNMREKHQVVQLLALVQLLNPKCILFFGFFQEPYIFIKYIWPMNGNFCAIIVNWNDCIFEIGVILWFWYGGLDL